MGTISGSGVANVVTVGQFTIPLMKRFGYKPSFAGGVEATASMGGQIMPPVMGAVAFIMAENIGVPYAGNRQGRDHPGHALFRLRRSGWCIWRRASMGCSGFRAGSLPSPLRRSERQWHLGLPLAVLVYLLMHGFTPLFAGSVGLAAHSHHDPGRRSRWGIGAPALRIAFWIGLGLVTGVVACGYGVGVMPASWWPLILANLITRGGRDTLVMCRDALADGARQALPVGLACAIVGVRHRHDDAHRLGHDPRQLHRLVRQRRRCSSARPGRDGDVDHPGHRAADDPDLHHHRVAGRARPAANSACR